MTDKQKVALPASTSVTGKVGIGQTPTGFGIEAALTVFAPGVDRDTLQALVEQAHIVWPYSNATRGTSTSRCRSPTEPRWACRAPALACSARR